MIISLDTETTGLDAFHGCRPFLAQMCDGKSNYYWWGYVDPYTREVTWEQDALSEIQNKLDSAYRIVTHNGNFDLRMLEMIGIDISSLHAKLEDTLIASHCICSGDEHGLKPLCLKYLGIIDQDETDLELATKEAIKQGRKKGYCVAKFGHKHFPALKKVGTEWWKMDYWLAPNACLKYGLLDVERTLRLWDVLKYEIMSCGLWEVYRKRMELLEVAYHMQSRGKYFYVDETEHLLTSYKRDITQHELNIRRLSGIPHKFDHNKPDHLIDLIHNRLGIPVVYKTDKGRPKMTKDVVVSYIKKNDHPALTELQAIKKKSKKFKDITSLKLWVDGSNRTHSNLNVTGTRETRQSSSAPNDQNIDKTLNYLFGPPAGYIWIHLDLVNIELLIWSFFSGNKDLMEIFKSGKSVHLVIFDLLFPEECALYLLTKNQPIESLSPEMLFVHKRYGYIKNGTFARIYGATDKKTNETYYNGKNPPENYCAKIDRRFPGVKQFMVYCKNLCRINYRKEGVYALRIASGYRLDVPPDEPFKANNFYIQGLAGWIVGDGMVDFFNHPTYRLNHAHMVSQVHDSITTEVSLNMDVQQVITDFTSTICNAGLKHLPICRATTKIQFHPDDETNPKLIALLNDN